MNRSRRSPGPTVLAKTAAALAAVGMILTGAGIVALARHVVQRVTRPSQSLRPPNFVFTPWEFGVEYETLRIRSDDCLLDAWYLPSPTGQASPSILILAGHGGNKSDLLGITTYLNRSGFNCLIFDYRGVGLSTGNGLSLGVRESRDAMAALGLLATHSPGSPIGVLGFSMGGSVAVGLAARDERVRSVAIDSAFATQRAIVTHHVHRTIRTRPEPVVETANLMLRRRHGFAVDDFAPIREVTRIAPRPVLIIHASDDRVVPLAHGLQMWRAAGEPKEFWLIRGTGHCGGYFHVRQQYCRRVTTFFRDSLSTE
jgi:uncharacterized protein